jgi:hypothetical protein
MATGIFVACVVAVSRLPSGLLALHYKSLHRAIVQDILMSDSCRNKNQFVTTPFFCKSYLMSYFAG